MKAKRRDRRDEKEGARDCDCVGGRPKHRLNRSDSAKYSDKKVQSCNMRAGDADSNGLSNSDGTSAGNTSYLGRRGSNGQRSLEIHRIAASCGNNNTDGNMSSVLTEGRG